MRVRQTNGLRFSTEFIDKVNPTKNRYRERPIFDLLDFFPTKDAGYVYLTVVTIGDRNGAPILVYQIGRPIVVLEKITDYLYRYPDPEDEVYTERLFEVEVIIDNIESKKKQAKVISDPSVYYLTSQIYPINLTETASTSSKGITGRILTTNDLRLYQSIFEESYTSLSRITGVFKQSLFQYAYKNTDNSLYEPVKINLNKVTGILRQLLQTYATVPENAKVGFSRVTGTMRQLLIQYNFYSPETLKTGVNKLDGSTVAFTPYHEIFISGNTVDYNPNDSDNGVTVIERTVDTGALNSVNDKGLAYKSTTTSALDFENGLTDRVNPGSVTWTKVGTGDLTTVNKLYSANSFETKALGDSLYTNSNILTGGATPFTIEFYALIKKYLSVNNFFNGCAILAQNKGGGDSDQQILIQDNRAYMYRGSNGGANPFSLTRGSTNINFNDINKYTLTYDGVALRFFINDKLDITVGTLTGWDSSHQNPFKFFDNVVSGYTQYRVGTDGIIDNINIHNGIATKIRDYDPYEENLIVDLAFDGENNSTKIVDNGTLNSNWTVSGNAKLSTTQPFDGFSSLYLDSTGGMLSHDQPILNEDIVTISFDVIQMRGDNNVYYDTYTGDYDGCFQLIHYNGTFGIWYSNIFESTGKTLPIGEKFNIVFTYENGLCKLYINGILYINKNLPLDFKNKYAIGGQLIYPNSNYYSNAYIKNFKIYKGVAVIPESPVGKIQLDFDNNVIDKYDNSTWTNNGVTFDQVNSVKGSAGYFNGSSNLQSNSNSLLNFENKNFNIEFDGNKLNNNQTYSSWLTPNGASYPSQWCELSSWNTNLQRFQNLAASAPELTGAVLNLNTWYKWQLIRNNGTVILKANDVVTGISNYTPSMNVNFSNGTGTNLIGVSSNAMNCYVDNFKSEKDYKGEIIIDKPAVHLPLETNAINTGFTPLTVNSVGEPTYTTIDGKKCIKFEAGKYLTIDSNNIFNLGTSSDFYIECNFYCSSKANIQGLLASTHTSGGANNAIMYIDTTGKIVFRTGNNSFPKGSSSSNTINSNTWQNIKVFRKNGTLVIDLNGVQTISTTVHDIDFSLSSTVIGLYTTVATYYLDGYMSNFKMFVGTSEIPETYNDKKVLDLDFKPTRKSYLFKDNNNKCVIHPVNITQRDYQDSQYCCTFDGVNQGITLAKNPALNIGKDDYVMYIRFKVADFTNVHQRLISDNYSNTGALSYVMITGDSYSNTSLTRRLFIGYSDSSAAYSYSTTQLEANTIYDAVFVRSGDTTNTYINGKLEATFNSTLPFDLNFQGETFIGRAGFNTPVSGTSSQMFKGTIYKVQIYRNTTDTSVLNLPILNTSSNLYLPLTKDSVDIKTGTIWANNSNNVIYENEAAKFDGNTATYLSTGANGNLNYGTNDFTIGIDSYKTNSSSESRLLSTAATSASIYPRTEIKNSPSIGITLVNFPDAGERVYKSTKSGDVLNNWYESKFTKTNNTLFTYINDSLVDMSTISNGTQFNINTNNSTMLGGVLYNGTGAYDYQGYIKNVYSNNVANNSLVLPYIYFPYDTMLSDLGVNNLTLTNTSTSAAVLDTLGGVKCTRITSTSTNPSMPIVLGTVFAIKTKIYIPTKASSGYHKPLFGTGYNSNIGFLLSQFTEPWSGNANPQLWLRTSGSNIGVDITSLIGTWIDVIVTKTLTTLTLNVNGVDVGSMDNSNWSNSDFEGTRTFYIGDAGTDWKESSTFYIKDFRFYKGLQSIPTNEVLSKKVLDLKFKKDDARVYPFKDESRRHIVSYNAMSKYNLVNIEGVDCAQFNGVDQYLELGNTKLMNFANEDFVIAFKLYLIPYVHTGSSQWQVILASGGTSSSSNVSYIAYDQTTKSLVIRATDNEVYRISNVLNEYSWNTVIITRVGDKFNTTINNNINLGVISSTANFNLNYNANTYIGIDKWNTSNEYLKGCLADLQIVRGSSDTSLIDVNTTETITIVNPPKAIYYPIKLNEVDSFSNSWYQTNATNPVRLKEYNKGVNTSMYFDGISGLQSNNTFNRIGLSPFTVECSILIDSPINVSYPMSIFSYGKDYNRPEWFNLEVTSTGVIRFCINKSTNEYVSSPVATINYNTKYNIAVTRDADYNLRIFVNGVIVANQVVTNCFDSYSQNSGYSYTTSSNWLVIGKQGPYWNRTDPSLGGFKGNIENFHYLVGTCKYTSNYTPSIDQTIKLETVSLINSNITMGTNPTTIPDTRNNIVYANNGCTIEALAGQLRPYSIRCQTISNRLISPVNESMFNLGTLNWTIDLIFRPMQTSAEAYLLDTRSSSTIFRGLVIRQPQTNPTTLMIEIGSSNAASAFENTYQTAANSLVVNTTYHLRLVRCIDVILVFMNGTLLTTINYGVKDIGYSNKIILFNNDLFTKGFNGYVTQFRFIKGISTDVFAFPQITQELK